jgi:hypothetical protein
MAHTLVETAELDSNTGAGVPSGTAVFSVSRLRLRSHAPSIAVARLSCLWQQQQLVLATGSTSSSSTGEPRALLVVVLVPYS